MGTFSRASEETGNPGTQLPKREGDTAGKTASLTLCSPPTQAPKSSSGSMKGPFCPPEKLDKKPGREPSGTEPAEMAPAPEEQGVLRTDEAPEEGLERRGF